MSAKSNRSGAPITPDITTVGTPGSVDEVRTFRDADEHTKDARPVYVTNTSTMDDLYVLVNEEDASDTNFLVKLQAGQAVELSTAGILNITFVSLYYVTDTYNKAQVRGWIP